MKVSGRSTMSAAVAFTAAAVLFSQTATSTPTTAASVALTANTLLVMGGNSNPNGLDMDRQLNGDISGKQGTLYAGYTFTAVRWSAQTPFSTFSDGTLFNDSQAEGVSKIDTALKNTYTPGSKIVIVGYSSSASVVSKEIAKLQALRAGQGSATTTPSPNDLSFITFGNPDRPNGGFFSRYTGYKIGPPLGVDFDPPLTPSDYKITDICRQYDGFCDYPVDGTNTLAVTNALVGMFTAHGSYFQANLQDPSSFLSDQQSGNTRFITLKGNLPLLSPLYAVIPSFLLAPLDAWMRPIIESAYDRKTPVGTPVTSKGAAPNDYLLQLVNFYLSLPGTSAPPTNPPKAPSASIATTGTVATSGATAARSLVSSESVRPSTGSATTPDSTPPTQNSTPGTPTFSTPTPSTGGTAASSTGGSSSTSTPKSPTPSTPRQTGMATTDSTTSESTTAGTGTGTTGSGTSGSTPPKATTTTGESTGTTTLQPAA